MLLGVLLSLKVHVYMNVSVSVTNSNTQRPHTNEYKLQHDFAAFNGLCMLKVSTSYVLVTAVNRHNIRNVLRKTLLSLQSTVSRFLEALQSTISCVCCQPYHSNEHSCVRKRVNLGINIKYSSVICFKATAIDICLQKYGKNAWF